MGEQRNKSHSATILVLKKEEEKDMDDSESTGIGWFYFEEFVTSKLLMLAETELAQIASLTILKGANMDFISTNMKNVVHLAITGWTNEWFSFRTTIATNVLAWHMTCDRKARKVTNRTKMNGIMYKRHFFGNHTYI